MINVRVLSINKQGRQANTGGLCAGCSFWTNSTAWLEETGSRRKRLGSTAVHLLARHDVPKLCPLFDAPNSTNRARRVAQQSVSIVPAYPN